MAQITVKDADGIEVPVELPPEPGRAAAASSRPVVLATEDKTALDAAASPNIVAHDAVGTSVNPVLVGGYASAAAPTSVSADGDATRLWLLRNGAAAVNVTAAGALIGGDATNGLDVDVTRVIPGTSATHLGKAVDSAAGSTDTGVAALFVRDDVLSTLTPADGDYSRAMVNSQGAQWVVPVATETHLGQTGGTTVIKDVTLSLDTAAYASGDLLADTQVVDAAMRITNGSGGIISLNVIDEDDQKAALTVYFLSSNVSLGTENSAPSISDTNALAIRGRVRVSVSDYDDLGGVAVACFSNLAIPVVAASGADDIYVAVVNGTGSPTYTASGIKLSIGLVQD